MVEYSYATERKIRKLKEHHGLEWEQELKGRSIDGAYNDLVGDNRKNLFCKIEVGIKDRLDEMVDHHRLKMAIFVEDMINREYARYTKEKADAEHRTMAEFAR